jgi:signal transduction histidine kinase
MAEREGSDLVIRVGNNGPPVPEAERPRIFGRYYRLEARREGARANRGLGLYFCKLVADAHRGTIEVESRPELPACFVLRVPQ